MNLHDEVLRVINQVGPDKVRAIHIVMFIEDNKVEYNLCLDHTEDDLKEYLQELDIIYNDPLKIYGCIWFTDGLWAEKNAGPTLDGYWHFHVYPKFPDAITENQGVTII